MFAQVGASVKLSPPSALCTWEVCPDVVSQVGALLGYAESFHTGSVLVVVGAWQVWTFLGGRGSAKIAAEADAAAAFRMFRKNAFDALVQPRLRRSQRPVAFTLVATVLLIGALVVVYYEQVSECETITAFSVPSAARDCLGVPDYTVTATDEGSATTKASVTLAIAAGADFTNFTLAYADLGIPANLTSEDTLDALLQMPYTTTVGAWTATLLPLGSTGSLTLQNSGNLTLAGNPNIGFAFFLPVNSIALTSSVSMAGMTYSFTGAWT